MNRPLDELGQEAIEIERQIRACLHCQALEPGICDLHLTAVNVWSGAMKP